MKKTLLLISTLLITASSYAQIAYLHYRNVPSEHEDKFV